MSEEIKSAEGAADEAPVDAGAARIAGLEAEIAGLKDQLLRALADQENLRRRSEREVKDAGTYAITKFARDMLAVSDNLRRALDAVSAEARDAADAALKGIIDGVEMTERDLLAGLDRHGVRKVEPLGEKFDPNFHQAMFEVPNPAAPNGTVIQVIQAGFVIGERVLRPALVGVARNPKPSDPAPEPLDKTI